MKDGHHIEIVLSQGKVAKVDTVDGHLANFRWHVAKVGPRAGYYATRKVPFGSKQKMVYLHHAVVGFPCGGFVVDHINGDTLDNRRANLRFVTVRQNSSNHRARREGKTSSQFVGVYYRKSSGRWRALIKIGGKQRYLGTFDEETKAAAAYQAAKP
jgi:hypothetical protein